MNENLDESKITNAPAPWELRGNGYILLYKFSKDFIFNSTFLEDYFKSDLILPIGGIMLIEYTDSNVGHYYELLFIPGLFKYRGNLGFSISKIYVSSVNSMVNGYNNWAIPKEIADFKFSKNGNILDVSVYKDNTYIFSIKLLENNFSIPFNNRFLPAKLIQKKQDKVFITDFFAKGRLSTVKILEISSDENYFPDINNMTPFLVGKASSFSMLFEKAGINHSE